MKVYQLISRWEEGEDRFNRRDYHIVVGTYTNKGRAEVVKGTIEHYDKLCGRDTTVEITEIEVIE